MIFRGEQYARAIELYQRQYVGAYPPDFDTLVEERFLRRLYKDPMTEDGVFRSVFQSQVGGAAGDSDSADGRREMRADERSEASSELLRLDDPQQGGVVGVVSANEDASLRIYNGRQKYNEWVFSYTPMTTQPGEAVGDDSPRRPRRGPTGPPARVDRGRFNLGNRRPIARP